MEIHFAFVVTKCFIGAVCSTEQLQPWSQAGAEAGKEQRGPMFHVSCIPASKLLFKEQEKLLRAGWRHQFEREQLKGAKKETISLQILKHSSSGQWNYSGQREGLWIFPSSHGMRGKGKFQLPTQDRSQEGGSAESLLPGKGQSVLPATSLSPRGGMWGI